jgi:Outer membrane protein beta-barrel domain
MRLSHALLAAIVFALTAAPVRGQGFITPFIGFNAGGDSGNCESLTNCQTARANFGVAVGAMGPVVGFEEDFSYARNFFGDAPGTSNSVLSLMSNLLVGVGVGPVRPYVVGGFGLIRPHVSGVTFSAENNTFGYDIGGGVNGFFSEHVGIRGDVRHFHSLQDINVLIFTGDNLNFWRASVGLALKF